MINNETNILIYKWLPYKDKKIIKAQVLAVISNDTFKFIKLIENANFKKNDYKILLDDIDNMKNLKEYRNLKIDYNPLLIELIKDTVKNVITENILTISDLLSSFDEIENN